MTRGVQPRHTIQRSAHIWRLWRIPAQGRVRLRGWSCGHGDEVKWSERLHAAMLRGAPCQLRDTDGTPVTPSRPGRSSPRTGAAAWFPVARFVSARGHVGYRVSSAKAADLDRRMSSSPLRAPSCGKPH